MRLLHIADVHLERPFAWLEPGRGRYRRSDLCSTFRRVVDLARERKVDALCIAGDLFEREYALPSAGEFLRASLATLGDVPTFIAPGNHDYLSPGCLYDQVSWPPNVHVFRTTALSGVPIGDGTLWGNAFDGPERRQSPLNDFVVSGSGPHLALCHAEIVDSGVNAVYAPLHPSEIATSGLDFAMLGHVHAGRIDEQRRFAYPGSLEPLDPTEAGPRGALLLDVANGLVRVERLPVARRRAISDEMDVSAFGTIGELQRGIAERQSAWELADVRLRLLGTLHGELEDTDAIRVAFRDVAVDLEIVAQLEDSFTGLSRQKTTLGAFVRDVQTRIDGAADDKQRRYWSNVLRVGVGAFRGREVAIS